MQFLILAYDAKDPDALNRRIAAREAHLATIDRYKATGNMHIGGALLNDDGKMIGSMLVVEFADRASLDNWLKIDPYVTGKVWDNITITPFKIAPSFVK